MKTSSIKIKIKQKSRTFEEQSARWHFYEVNNSIQSLWIKIDFGH